jgi:hypothetical protein
MKLLRDLIFHARLILERMRYRIAVPLRCSPQYPTEGRDSPYASLPFSVGGRDALLCYGRPSARGRTVFGGLVPAGELWRMGANEPTTLHLPFRASVGGLPLSRGVYSLYAIPGPEWTLVVNRSTRQSGRTRDERGKGGRLFPNAYTRRIASAEVGRARVEARPGRHVEQLTFSARQIDGTRTDLVLAWEELEVVIPVTAR